jgi:hypothetical protein
MKFRHRLPTLAAICLAPFLLTGAAEKPDFFLSFNAEGNPQDTNTFSQQVEVPYPTPHKIYVEKVPRMSERDVQWIFLTQADDGTFGCTFQLNETGRLHLEVLSGDLKGKSLVVFLRTKNSIHLVINLVIDRQITDGIIFVPHGFSTLEAHDLTKGFKVMNPKRPKGEGKKS